MRLDTSLSDLRLSTQRSIEMIKEYNFKNTENPIAVGIDFNSIQSNSYAFNDAQMSVDISEIKQKLNDSSESFNEHSDEGIEETQVPPQGNQNNFSGFNSGGSYGSGGQTSSGTSNSQNKNEVEPNIVTTDSGSDTKETDSEIEAYKSSISDMTEVIEKINQNLN